ncbi:hypothetical protein [Amycolatopsis sp. cmx-8-4]
MCETFLIPEAEDPDARNQALAGWRTRNDRLGTLTTWPTISLRAG